MSRPDPSKTHPVDPSRFFMAHRGDALPRLERLLLVVAVALYLGVDLLHVAFTLLGRA